MQGTERDQASEEKSHQQALTELQPILMGQGGVDHSQKDHEDAEENIRVVGEGDHTSQRGQMGQGEPDRDSVFPSILDGHLTQLFAEDPAHHQRGRQTGRSRPPSKVGEEVGRVPVPLRRHHEHRRCGEVGQRAADGNVDEQQAEGGVGEFGTDAAVEITVFEQDGQQGHGRRFCDEGTQERAE